MDNTLLQNSFEVLVTFIEISFFYYYIFHRFPAKKKPPFPWQLFLSAQLIVTFILNYYTVSSYLTLSLALLLELTFTFFWMEGTYTEKLFWGCLYRIIDLVADSMVFFVLDLFGGSYGANDIITTYPVRYIICSIYLVILATFTILITHIKWKRIALPIWLLPSFSVLVIFSIIAVEFLLDILIYLNSLKDYSQDRLLYTAILIFLFVCVFLLVLIVYINYIYRNNIQLMEEQQIYKLEHQQLELIQNTSEALRIWKHDLHHHLSAISGLLSAGKSEDAAAYVQHISNNFENLSLGVFTGNQMIDAILSAKLVPIQQAEITFTRTIYLPNTLPLDDISIISLLGNLLDNAITARLLIPDKEKRYISLSIKPFQDTLTICIENSSTGDYRYDKNNALQSTKAEALHGMGLKRVQEISESINGFCEIEAEADKFTVTVVLPLAREAA